MSETWAAQECSIDPINYPKKVINEKESQPAAFGKEHVFELSTLAVGNKLQQVDSLTIL